MDNCSLKAVTFIFTVTIFCFHHSLEKETQLLIISLFKKLIYETQNNLH